MFHCAMRLILHPTHRCVGHVIVSSLGVTNQAFNRFHVWEILVAIITIVITMCFILISVHHNSNQTVHNIQPAHCPRYTPVWHGMGKTLLSYRVHYPFRPVVSYTKYENWSLTSRRWRRNNACNIHSPDIPLITQMKSLPEAHCCLMLMS